VLAIERALSVAQQLVDEEDPGGTHRAVVAQAVGKRREESGAVADGYTVERRRGRHALDRGRPYDAPNLTLSRHARAARCELPITPRRNAVPVQDPFVGDAPGRPPVRSELRAAQRTGGGEEPGACDPGGPRNLRRGVERERGRREGEERPSGAKRCERWHYPNVGTGASSGPQPFGPVSQEKLKTQARRAGSRHRAR
jgi:hypothetical protein